MLTFRLNHEFISRSDSEREPHDGHAASSYSVAGSSSVGVAKAGSTGTLLGYGFKALIEKDGIQYSR